MVIHMHQVGAMVYCEFTPNSLLWVTMAILIDGYNCVQIIGGNNHRQTDVLVLLLKKYISRLRSQHCPGQCPSMKNLATPLLVWRMHLVSIAEYNVSPDNIYRYTALPVFCREHYLLIDSVDNSLWLSVYINIQCYQSIISWFTMAIVSQRCQSIVVNSVYRQAVLFVSCGSHLFVIVSQHCQSVVVNDIH